MAVVLQRGAFAHDLLAKARGINVNMRENASLDGVTMRLRASICDRLADVVRRVSAIFALPIIVLGAAPAAAEPSKREQLEQRLLEVVDMFQKDPRYNRGKTPQQIKDSAEFVTGNVLFVLGHETGHALISEFALPVLGREEDAADSLASIVAIKMASSFADRVVVNAARGWFLSDQRDRGEGVPTAFYDEHGIDVQRAYNIVCLLVGGHPEKFARLADDARLPPERRRTCRDDFNNASWSWEQVLKPHLRKPGDPKTNIEVNYGPPGDHAALAETGRKLLILETVAEWLSEDFAWKNPISLEMQECGSPGARWEFKAKKVVVCYEIIREFVQLYRDYGQKPLVPGGMMVARNKQIISSGKQARKGTKSYRPAR
jgi:hypothetical protein